MRSSSYGGPLALKPGNENSLVTKVVRALYEPWLDRSARRFQELMSAPGIDHCETHLVGNQRNATPACSLPTVFVSTSERSCRSVWKLRAFEFGFPIVSRRSQP